MELTRDDVEFQAQGAAGAPTRPVLQETGPSQPPIHPDAP